VRGPLNKVGLADRPPHPKFAERISTSPRKRGEVSHTVASIQFKAIMLSSWNRIGKIKERRQRCLRFRLTVATGKSNRWIFSKCLSSGFSRIRLVMASTSGFCKYPPAEPGALGIGPLEAAVRVADATLHSLAT
jgi:hypothetical protein